MLMLQCSTTCGGGIKTRTLDCARAVDVEEDEYSIVPDEFCKNAVKPPVTEMCNVDILCEGNNDSKLWWIIVDRVYFSLICCYIGDFFGLKQEIPEKNWPNLAWPCYPRPQLQLLINHQSSSKQLMYSMCLFQRRQHFKFLSFFFFKFFQVYCVI